MDVSEIIKILNANKSKNFVDRIINKENYPVIDLGNGDYATHLMSWEEDNKGYYVYPNILYENGKLVQRTGAEAVKAAKKAGEFIKFDNPTDADSFSKEYKKVWNDPMFELGEP
ncbi:MAG: hypothetical protein KKD77_21665 [Gammaproteobacteria bacterium]|nr:hypothetical protein [Gammaproteobacteria bacterium]